MSWLLTDGRMDTTGIYYAVLKTYAWKPEIGRLRHSTKN